VSTIASNQGTGGSPGSCGGSGTGLGGGLYAAGTLTVSNSTLSGNTGGGIYNSFGTLMVSNSTLSGNTGGGISNSATLTVSNSTLSGNTGGGIYNSFGTLTVSNSTLSGNSATYGGGIDNYYGTLAVTNSTLSGNTAIISGGIYNYSGTLTVSNSTLSLNTATYGGGGIYNYYGTLAVTNSTLSTNSAFYGEGGGIYNVNGMLTVSNSTLSGNTATRGGGVFTDSSPLVTLTNVTLTANRVTYYGGGLDVYFSAPGLLHNTLIAGNYRGATRDDVNGALDPGGDYNLIGDGTGMTGLSNGVNGNLVGSLAAPIDPLLGPLQDNGGPTQTHALLAGSPAIDAGNNVYASMWDQRGPGFPRIEHGIIDIGAFEYRPPRQPQLDPNPVPIQGLSPPGATNQHVFGPAQPSVDAQELRAIVPPGQPDTTPEPARAPGALPARDAVLETWSDPLADLLAGL
jgi:hypothetical protein